MDIIPKIESIHLLPRIHITNTFKLSETIKLNDDSNHYLRNVLRLENGAYLRIFNENSGEFLAELQFSDKKNILVNIIKLLRQFSPPSRRVHIIFSPLKKDKMDFLIEKAVELGATDFHPVIFNRSVVRDVKEERIIAQIINASEQCERIDIPRLYPITTLTKLLRHWDENIIIAAALERRDCPSLNSLISNISGDIAYLVGGEGGISPNEMDELLGFSFVKPVNLGSRILRAETAVLFGLSVIGAND